jgi:response regulator RpfG family c-di-GMP phosphodiesterase
MRCSSATAQPPQRAIALADTAVTQVAIAGLLRDIGKVGVPDRLMKQSGQLTDAELSMTRQHAEMGASV